MNYVLLLESQLRRAKARGERHQREAEAKQRGGSYRFPLAKHILGAQGELAVSVWSGLPWTGENEFRQFNGADVGENIQVKTRDIVLNPKCMDMYLLENNPEQYKYVLVRKATKDLFILCGWIWGYDAKHIAYWHQKLGHERPAYWVPQEELRQMEEL